MFVAEGIVILTSTFLMIPEGTTSNMCVQLMAGQGSPTELNDDLVVPLSVTLDGGAGTLLI